MGVYNSTRIGGAKQWPRCSNCNRRVIPYRVSDEERFQDCAADVEEMIARFNARFERDIFVPVSEVANGDAYVVTFKSSPTVTHSCCPIGFENDMPRPKVLSARLDQHSLFHEMGHCIGLGHENYHTDWNLVGSLEGLEGGQSIHWKIYSGTREHYKDFGAFDQHSVMIYSSSAYGLGDTQTKNDNLSDGDIRLIRAIMSEIQFQPLL